MCECGVCGCIGAAEAAQEDNEHRRDADAPEGEVGLPRAGEHGAARRTRPARPDGRRRPQPTRAHKAPARRAPTGEHPAQNELGAARAHGAPAGHGGRRRRGLSPCCPCSTYTTLLLYCILLTPSPTTSPHCSQLLLVLQNKPPSKVIITSELAHFCEGSLI